MKTSGAVLFLCSLTGVLVQAFRSKAEMDAGRDQAGSNTTLLAPTMAERVAGLRSRCGKRPSKECRSEYLRSQKCTISVSCEGETFTVESLQCPGNSPGTPWQQDCSGYAGCLSYGLKDLTKNPHGIGKYEPTEMCDQDYIDEFRAWDSRTHGPLGCNLRVDKAKSENDIKQMCLKDASCWGYSIFTDVLIPESPDVRYAICNCEQQSALECGNGADLVVTYLRVKDEIDWVLEEPDH